MQYRDSKLRSWAKSIAWRMLGIVILGGLVWIFTGSWEKTTYIAVSFHAIRVILYYWHERIWERVKWQRYDY